MSMQGQVQQAGLEAEAAARGHETPNDSPAVDKALDPTSDFPEKPLDSPEQQEAMKEMKDPAGGMANTEKMAIKAPVAGKSGQGDVPGDMVGGINKGVGDAIGSVGDTEAGHKGTGGVDISNAAGSGV